MPFGSEKREALPGDFEFRPALASRRLAQMRRGEVATPIRSSNAALSASASCKRAARRRR